MAPSRAASARSRASTTVDDATLDDLARATIGDLDRCASTRARHVGVGVDALCGGECPRHDDEDQHPRFHSAARPTRPHAIARPRRESRRRKRSRSRVFDRLIDVCARCVERETRS
jgi:hypothetical protein